ncbi:MAG: dihydroorotate dehydrogenase (quinone), partial [Pseudomonadota bacterium]
VIDFATVNVSSPNTENLRDLQGPEALRALLEDVAAVRAGLVRPVPLFLKIAPDLDRAALAGIAAVAEAVGVDAIIATNTTTERPNLRSRHGKEAGGLSGAPLFERSTEVLRTLARQTPLPLIGVGGIATAEQAYAKIRAGASALQLYSALVYGGLSLVRKIHIGLAACLARDGFMCLSDAVGADLR